MMQMLQPHLIPLTSALALALLVQAPREGKPSPANPPARLTDLVIFPADGKQDAGSRDGKLVVRVKGVPFEAGAHYDYSIKLTMSGKQWQPTRQGVSMEVGAWHYWYRFDNLRPARKGDQAVIEITAVQKISKHTIRKKSTISLRAVPVPIPVTAASHCCNATG
jgi:hypothetical protein